MQHLEKLKDSFQKLKSYFYYDNSLHFERDKILKFEQSGMLEKLESLSTAIDQNDVIYFDQLIKDINFKLIPKSVKTDKAQKENHSNYYINKISEDADILIEKVNVFIDCPVEIHLMSVLFLEALGPKIELSIHRSNYGNRLEIDSRTESLQKGYRLFKPYYEQYKGWRDNCIKISKSSVESGSNVAILNLDLKSFYYSCNFSFDDIRKISQFEYDQMLIDFIEKVHMHFNKLIGNSNNSLPIGLLTSGVLANFYLRFFDHELMNKLNPIYYGRYVDDILIALNINEIPKSGASVVDNFMENYFVRQNILTVEEGLNGFEKNYLISKYEKNTRILIQKSKVLIHFFDSTGSHSLLDKIMSEVSKNSSEFRFLPDDDKGFSFDDSSHSLIYKDSSNSIRNIREYSANRFEISKYFARLNMISGLTSENEPIPDKTFKEIKNFFRCGSAIDLFMFWEKAFTSYVLNNRMRDFESLIIQIRKAIQKVQISEDYEAFGFSSDLLNEEGIKKFLYDHLNFSISQALSLNIGYIEKDLKLLLNTLGEYKNVSRNAYRIVRGHYIRHHLVLYPFLNFLSCSPSKKINYTSKSINYFLHLIKEIEQEKLIFSKRVIPRFIHYHEIQIYLLLCEIVRIAENHGKGGIRSMTVAKRTNKYFMNLNNLSILDEALPQVKVNEVNIGSLLGINGDISIKVFNHSLNMSHSSFLKRKIGLVNLQIDEGKLLKNVLNGENLSHKDFFKFAKVLNESNYEECDYTVFPEASVPASWLPLMVSESKNRGKSFIAGLEHFEFAGIVFNVSINALSFKSKEYNNVYLVARLKNFPAPEEKRIFEGHSKLIGDSVKYLKQAETSQNRYDLVHHQGIVFTLFNCFEISDIVARSIFRSLVDIVFIVENNKDITYFSSIVDSVSRDLHCFVAQVNNSKWGDSRITMPASSEKKDLLKVKGGVNTFLITDTLNLLKLRNFQRLSYELQKESGEFKPIPPGFKTYVKRKVY